MMEIKSLIYYIAIFIALIIPGFALGKRDKIPDSALKSFSVILSHIAMPFLVLSKFLEADLHALSLIEILCCCLFPVFVFFAIWGVSSLCFKREEEKRRSAEKFCAIFANCGFLGIPLAAVLFPSNPEVCVFVALFNAVSTFLMLTGGIYILFGKTHRPTMQEIFLRPITFAVILGVLSSFVQSDILSSLKFYSNILASLTTPMAMLVLGILLSRLKIKEVFACRALYLCSALRLLVSPLLSLVLLAVFRFVLGEAVSAPLAAAIIISTGVSTAATAPAMAKQYGSDEKLATILTLGSTLLCIITLPLMFLVFNLFF